VPPAGFEPAIPASYRQQTYSLDRATSGISHCYVCMSNEMDICAVDWVWNVMAYAQKPDFVFRRNGRVHLNRQVRNFSRLLAVKLCASAVLMLDTPCFELVWRVLATHSVRQFPLYFPSRAGPCAITFHLDSTNSTTQPHPDCVPRQFTHVEFYLTRNFSGLNSIQYFYLKRRKNMTIMNVVCKGKGKAIPLLAWTSLGSSRKLRFPYFKTIGTWRW